MIKKDGVAYAALFTFVACLVFVLPLALANEATKARVSANKALATKSAVLRAFGIGSGAPGEVEEKFAALVTELPEGRGWRATLGGKEWRALRRSGPGLWGTITMIVAADPERERLRGIEVLDQQETPGLGGRIDETWFKEQFRGERLGVKGLSLAREGGSGDLDHDNASIDAISGASLTSAYVLDIVNGSLADFASEGGTQ